MYVLTFPYPHTPDCDTQTVLVDQYCGWLKDDEMVRCYILDSMFDLLKFQNQSFSTIGAIMLNL